MYCHYQDYTQRQKDRSTQGKADRVSSSTAPNISKLLYFKQVKDLLGLNPNLDVPGNVQILFSQNQRNSYDKQANHSLIFSLLIQAEDINLSLIKKSL